MNTLTDKQWVEEQINAAYGLSKPAIIWCTSPLEVMARAAMRTVTHPSSGITNPTYPDRLQQTNDVYNAINHGLSYEHNQPSQHWGPLLLKLVAPDNIANNIFPLIGTLGNQRLSNARGNMATSSYFARNAQPVSGPCASMTDIVFISEAPTAIRRHGGGALNCLDRPAIEYPDGFGFYVLNGLPIEPWVYLEPVRFTQHYIRTLSDEPRRRALLEKYGWGKYIMEQGNTTVLDRDPIYGTLYRGWYINSECGVLHVKNATAEPDGSIREFDLVVPPGFRFAKDAVAWTYGKQGSDYNPAQQT